MNREAANHIPADLVHLVSDRNAAAKDSVLADEIHHASVPMPFW